LAFADPASVLSRKFIRTTCAVIPGNPGESRGRPEIREIKEKIWIPAWRENDETRHAMLKNFWDIKTRSALT
jgi:hypothetical protein